MQCRLEYPNKGLLWENCIKSVLYICVPNSMWYCMYIYSMSEVIVCFLSVNKLKIFWPLHLWHQRLHIWNIRVWRDLHHLQGTLCQNLKLIKYHKVMKLTHSLPGATTHAGSWPTQEAASNHLCLWPWPSSSWLPTFLHPSSFHQSISGLAFLLVFCPSAYLR